VKRAQIIEVRRRGVVSEIRGRETVVLADDYDGLVKWYRDVLGFRVIRLFDDGFHYCNLETASGIKVGIALASEMGVTSTDRGAQRVILQFEVDDVREFFATIEGAGGTIVHPATFNEQDRFWFGAIADPEGNQCWVVDSQCPSR